MGTLIEIDAPEGTAEAYLTGDADDPGVLLFIDAFGVRPQIEQMADRIASWGYAVLAPNVFYRHGAVAELAPTIDLREPGNREEYFATVFGRVRGYTPELSAPDTAAWMTALRAHAAGPIGVTGYCMGARLAVRAACLHPDDVAACGGWHGGGLATDADDSPHLLLEGARAEFVFGHADQDRSMPAEAVARLGEALTARGLVFTNEVYAGAAHGYTMADTAAYDEQAAERHFTELEGLLGRTLR